MHRQQPYLSFSGLIIMLILLVGLGLSLWRTGGRSFSPGELSAKNRTGISIAGFSSHSDFQGECSRCHRPLQVQQAVLCKACHTSIDEQIELSSGTHAHIDKVDKCASCHVDHQGTGFDPTQSAYRLFDHAATGFSLNWHQFDYDRKPLTCEACHSTGSKFSLSPSNCIDCHTAKDTDQMIQHQQDYGFECLNCHDGKDSMVEFDHATTGFLLEGKHNQISCITCHENASQMLEGEPGGRAITGAIANAAVECAQCHSEPPVHLHVFSDDCGACHTSATWSPATWMGGSFNHMTQTGFNLALHKQDFSGEPITCFTCHTQELTDFDGKVCIACHSRDGQSVDFMNQHQEKFGSACVTCHDGVDRMHDFNHDRYFILNGRHSQLECETCHLEGRFAGTAQQCLGCHLEPALHSGSFGEQCEYCHTTHSWSPARLVIHPFPLDHGGQGEVACQVCHPDRYTANTCYGCHDHQESQIVESHIDAGIPTSELSSCTRCHSDGT
jgi:hypothetical protein